MVLQALPVRLVEPTADLLCSAFVASVAALGPYQRYLRNNISKYLREHQVGQGGGGEGGS